MLEDAPLLESHSFDINSKTPLHKMDYPKSKCQKFILHIKNLMCPILVQAYSLHALQLVMQSMNIFKYKMTSTCLTKVKSHLATLDKAIAKGKTGEAEDQRCPLAPYGNLDRGPGVPTRLD